MYTAVIIACHILLEPIPQNCLTIVDNRGPYKDAARCEERMIEMVKDLSKFWKKQELEMAYHSMECVNTEEEKKTEV